MAESVWIPKEEFVMPEGAEETWLGDPKGSVKQYRAGNLHIREYLNCFEVHEDKVDPRRDPLGHLIKDAPEYLVAGVAIAVVSAVGLYAWHRAKRG